MARRQAVHRRRRRLQLGNTPRIPATAATTIGSYKDVKVEKVDDYTVKVIFDKPTPFWADAFVGANGMIIPKHLFERLYRRQVARGADQPQARRHRPLYVQGVSSPGDLVTGVINPNYHQANRPYFDAIEMKGGGDAVSAARAVLQTGEYDFAWNLQVEDEILTAAREGRQGPVAHHRRRQHRAYPAQQHRSLDRGRRRALEHQDQASDACPTRPCARRCRCWSTTASVAEVHLRPHRRRRRANFVYNPERFRSQEHRNTSSTSTRRSPARQGRLEAGRRRHPREGRQEAQISSSRPRSTSRARRPRRSSSRPARRPASRSSSSR